MKMYKTEYHSIVIKESEVVKVTDKTITFIEHYKDWRSDVIKTKNSIEGLHTTWHEWHKTKEDAINFLLKRTECNIKGLKQQIKSLEGDLKELKNLENDNKGNAK